MLAQGEGSRWANNPRHQRFNEEAPIYKQLLAVRGEPILARSAKLFRSRGFDVTVVASPELLMLSGTEGITLEDPGTDILECVLKLMELYPATQITVMALGDVIFSRDAVEKLAEAVESQPMGCMARVFPSKVCDKVADEVFAIWYWAEQWPIVEGRARVMVMPGGKPGSRPLRPRKPWAFPFAVAPDLNRVRRGYKSDHGLKSIEGDLLTILDYTDDVDSPEEWLKFWYDLLAAAEADIGE